MSFRTVLVGSTLLAFTFLPGASQAAPDAQTTKWEQTMVSAMRTAFCGPNGTMARMFKVTSAKCQVTYDYATKHCFASLHAIPYYRVSDATTGATWGKYYGMCVGSAYDMKYTYHQPIP
jgi:hypothetical protein